VLLTVHTKRSWWRWTRLACRDRPREKGGPYTGARLIKGEPCRVVWAPGPVGGQRRTHSSDPSLKIVDLSPYDEVAARLLFERVRTGNEPMRR
jgi:hypothetical protein